MAEFGNRLPRLSSRFCSSHIDNFDIRRGPAHASEKNMGLTEEPVWNITCPSNQQTAMGGNEFHIQANTRLAGAGGERRAAEAPRIPERTSAMTPDPQCAPGSYGQCVENMPGSLRGPLRPPEFPFTTEERDRVTILFGGLTWKHERLIEGLLRGAGYRSRRLPETDRAAHELGREFCASGLCNPVYFTVGNLIRYLRSLEGEGLTRDEIVRKYVYFTAACGGPCRFGMYESEFRTALNAAGYYGFRVLSFSQDRGILASTGHSGMQFSVDFGMNTLHMFILGDLLHGLQHQLRPFEVQTGATDKAIAAAADAIAAHFERHRGFALSDFLPAALLPDQESPWYFVPNRLGKIILHLRGDALLPVLTEARAALEKVEVDWLRVRPVVKVIGEFWAQMTESDGNFRMLEFLEKECAEVSVEPISTWLLYLLHHRKAGNILRFQMAARLAPWRSPAKALRVRAAALLKWMAFAAGERIYRRHYQRLAGMLGAPNQSPAPQQTLTELAAPWFDTALRGGEGHLEVAKTLYYTQNKLCHLVLALKPFGCLPSTQSDAVQACLVERFPEVNFLPIETSADGEIHAYSRVQMALSEARAQAATEFERALEAAHHSLEEIRSFVAEHPALRHPLCPIPRQAGVVSTAANFLLYADRLMPAASAGAHVPAGFPVTAMNRLNSREEMRS